MRTKQEREERNKPNHCPDYVNNGNDCPKRGRCPLSHLHFRDRNGNRIVKSDDRKRKWNEEYRPYDRDRYSRDNRDRDRRDEDRDSREPRNKKGKFVKFIKDTGITKEEIKKIIFTNKQIKKITQESEDELLKSDEDDSELDSFLAKFQRD